MRRLMMWSRAAVCFAGLLPCLGTAPLEAQSSGAGTAMFPFLNNSYDARSAAMAGASVAMPNGLYAWHSNPGGIGFAEQAQLVLGYRSVAGGLYGAPLAYAMPPREKGVFAFGLCALTSGRMAVTDIGNDGSPVPTGQFARADFIAGAVSWAKRINGFSSAGIAAKCVYNYLGTPAEHYSADGFAVDGGIQVRFMNTRLIYGFVARNVGVLRSGYVSGDDYPLPLAVETGISYVPRYVENMRLTMDINKKTDDYLMFEPGLELEIVKGQMLVRGGYGFSWRDLKAGVNVLRGEPEENYIKSNLTTFCTGVGFRTSIMEKKASFDAALEFAQGGGVLPDLAVSLLLNL